MLIFEDDQMRRLFKAIAMKFNMSEKEADCWIEHCMQVELTGNLMQGIAYLEHHWIERFSDGRVIFGAEIKRVKETPSMVVLDAGGALGAFAGSTAMGTAVEKAKQTGACVVSVRNSNDWGMISFAARQALKHDCIGIVMVNSRPEVAPWGGVEATVGLNPFSFAIPAGKHFPIVLDMSSSDTGGLKTQDQLILGEMPEGQFFDEKGQILTDPSKWGTEDVGWGIADGAHKMSGYRDLGLTVVMDLMGGALSGMSCALDLGTAQPAIDGLRTPRGQFCMAIDIDQFTPIEEFKSKVDRMIDQVKSCRLQEGFSEILMPGERGFREAEKRRKEGIPVHEKVWKRVSELAEELDIDLESVVGKGRRV